MYDYDRRASTPAFSNYQEALAWIKAKNREYGGVRRFQSSPEYREAYPEILRLQKAEAEATGATVTHYSDGRLVPKAGDTVYQVVSGMFGSSASLIGIVTKGGRVKITGGASMIAPVPIGKTMKLTPAWTVRDDPSVAARREEEERKKVEGETREQEAQAEADSTVEAKGKQMGLRRLKSLSDLAAGDEAFHLYSDYRHGRGTPTKVHVERHLVKDVSPRYFTYDEHGIERTSGNFENYWIKR